MEQALLQSSENIKEIIRVMRIHEENMMRHMTDNDVVMHTQTPIETNTYIEYEYASLPSWCIHKPYIKSKDPMILIKECGHICRKEHFLQWIKHYNTCMECSTVLF